MSAPLRRATPEGVLVLPAGAPRDQWLEARRWREGIGFCIGASDVPSILDLSDVGTPREVYHEKTGRIVKPENESMRWGRLHEKTIADEWQHRRQAAIRNVGLISNIERPWLQCTLDRRVTVCPDNREVTARCALEVKTRGTWRSAGVRWHAEVPDDILAQDMFQMMVTGYRHIHNAVLVGGSELHDPVVWWDQEVADYILAEVEEFRVRYLEAGIEPPWSTAKPTKEIALDKLMHPDRVGELGIVDVGEVMDYARLAAEAGSAERARKAQQSRLLEMAGGKRTLTFDDRPACWWREGTDTNVNLDVLARYPEAYAAAVTTKTTWTIQVAKEYKPSEARVS